MKLCSSLIVALLLFSPNLWAAAKFKRVVTVIFENEDASVALQQPFFASLADQGALLANFSAETHPSQANYIALTSGDLQGVKGDGNVNLDVANVADLIEAQGLSWKVYAENFPGNCFTKASKGKYARKHVPFISYVNIQSNSDRCARIQDENAFDQDVASGNLPTYSLYVPNLDNDGHDTGVAFADKWFSKKFGKLVKDASFMKDTLLIVTFDENSGLGKNKIYTVLLGDQVQTGFASQNSYSHYSLLRLVEDELGLGTLGLKDQSAATIDDVWRP